MIECSLLSTACSNLLKWKGGLLLNMSLEKKERDSINSINSAFQLLTASEAPGAPLGVPYKLLAII